MLKSKCEQLLKIHIENENSNIYKESNDSIIETGKIHSHPLHICKNDTCAQTDVNIFKIDVDALDFNNLMES